jgi:hypothetical protein
MEALWRFLGLLLLGLFSILLRYLLEEIIWLIRLSRIELRCTCPLLEVKEVQVFIHRRLRCRHFL